MTLKVRIAPMETTEIYFPQLGLKPVKLTVLFKVRIKKVSRNGPFLGPVTKS